MKTASKIALLLAVAGWLWYQGFNAGWQQAVELGSSASRADSAASPHVLPFPSGNGDSYQQRL